MPPRPATEHARHLDDPHPRGAAALAFRLRDALVAAAAIPIPLWAVLGERPLAALELALGAAAFLGGLALRLASVRRIGKHARVRRAGAVRLLEEGPFAWSRNPIYLANLAMLFGFGLLAGGGPWALAPLAAGAAVYALVVRHEERALATLFGAEYAAYRARVPRWLGRARRHAAPAARAPRFPWGELVRREANPLIGLPLAVAAIVAARLELLPLRALVGALGAPLGLSPPATLLLLLGLGVVATGARSYERAERKARARAAKVGGAS